MPTLTKAAATYQERYAEAEYLLAMIANRLPAHREQQAKDPANWGHAGELGAVNEALAVILAQLGDRSAVEAKNISF